MPIPDEHDTTPAPRRRRRRWPGRLVIGVLLVAWIGTAAWHTRKPLAPGVHVRAAPVALDTSDVEFLRDVTTADPYGQPIIDQEIFDEVLRIVREARSFVLVDAFLFNDHRGALAPDARPHRELSAELRDALLERRAASPALRMLVVTDPINDVYGGQPSELLAKLRAAGIDVAVTDLDVLRDPNPAYSALWRLAVRWWGEDGRGDGWLPNPLDAGPDRVTFRAWARLMNFKANHRKVVIADDGAGDLVGLVTSANPHDASSAHSNVAVRLRGPALRPLLASELAIARTAGWRGDWPEVAVRAAAPDAGSIARVQVLTEGGIRDVLLEAIASASAGERIDVAMFYLSEREVLRALRAAAARGVEVRVLLDPNKDAFGRTKSGIPNRPVASELVTASDARIRVRWYRTRGEQFHVKLVAIHGPTRFWMTLGSANLTRRNIGDYNLEANVAVETAPDAPIALEVADWFETLWKNPGTLGVEYSADFGVYADPAQRSYWAYRIMEATGLSTF
jgi:hypothetical protein